MREIKFRGKEIKEGNFTGWWVFGDYCSIPNPNILFKNSNDEIDCAVIDPETVGQFTGLKDKNGTEIYEGDIVECVYDGILNVYVVVYDLSELGFKGTNGKANYGNNFEYLQCCEEIIVIGNIYENKDLLEVE